MTLHIPHATLHKTLTTSLLILSVMGDVPAIAQDARTSASSAALHTEQATSKEGLTLAECYQLALARSETIAIQQELLKETEGRFLQALSGVLPRASFEWSEKRQDGSGGSAFTLKEIPERKFVFTQPLFSGFKEFAALAGARAERRQRQQEQARARQLLFLDVSEAFYALIEQDADLEALISIHTALVQRLDELRDRRRLGRSRPSEVAGSQAQLRRIEAEMELASSQAATRRHLVEFLTGLPKLEASPSDGEPFPPPLETEEHDLATVEKRPDVRAADEAWQVAKKAVTVAQAKIWPTLSLESNYYTKRIGVSSGVDWDVLLKTTVPLFGGGQTTGAVKEAAARAREAKLRLEQTRREAVLEIRDASATLRGAIARTQALQEALKAAEENYRLQMEDYQVNLVNTLDVLQALQQLQDARRDAIHALYHAKRLGWRLRIAAGETP